MIPDQKRKKKKKSSISSSDFRVQTKINVVTVLKNGKAFQKNLQTTVQGTQVLL